MMRESGGANEKKRAVGSKTERQTVRKRVVGGRSGDPVNNWEEDPVELVTREQRRGEGHEKKDKKTD